MEPNVINVVHDHLRINDVVSLPVEDRFAAAAAPPPQIAAMIPPLPPSIIPQPNVINVVHDDLRIIDVVSLPVEHRFAAAAPMIPHRRRQRQVRRPVVHLMVLRNGRSTHYNLRR